MQLLKTKVASAPEVAAAFGVTTVTLWRWTQSFAKQGVAGLVRVRSGPKGPSKLTGQLKARIVELDAQGLSLRAIVARTEVSTATVRVALGRVTTGARKPDTAGLLDVGDQDDEGQDVEGQDVEREEGGGGQAGLVVRAAPVPRTAERAAARAGELV